MEFRRKKDKMETNQDLEIMLNTEAQNEQKIPVKEISAKTTAENLLMNLSAKQKLILLSRFGIGNGGPKTLEAIGKSLNITRERVRQIESDAIKALSKVSKDASTQNILAGINAIIEEAGGITTTDNLCSKFFSRQFGKNDFTSEECRTAEVIFLVAGLKKNKDTREFRDSWVGPKFDSKYFRAVVDEAEKIFDSDRKVLETEGILKKLDVSELSKRYSPLRPDHIISFLEVSKKFGRNVLDDWGKAKWPLVSPRGVREKATLVLLKKKKPLHFREISRLIVEMKLSQKKVHPQTVHNELIRDKRFVLVGRGTYALREWGFEEGTVKEVLGKLLVSAGGYLSKEKLYQGVMKKRKVKKATIAVNLADKNMFEKRNDGYQLKEKKD